ncbi:MAG: tetratricopeptide repeat protein, partial [Gammaproteobacteria bacterium]|nr:tetratricopeptide repeat protein [Gammaproteobacteria bacterium]
MQKFKFSIFLSLLFPLVITACSTTSVTSDAGDGSAVQISKEADAENNAAVADEQQLTSHEKVEAAGDTEVSVASAEEKAISLDGDTLYNLLAAEFAGNAGDIDASLDYYREASKSIEDSRIAARTAYIALYGKNYDETLAALARWRELEPDAKDLPRMYALTYLKLEQPEKAVPYIEEMLSIYHESSTDEAMAVKQLLAKESRDKDAYVVLKKLNEKGDKNKHLLVLQSRYAAQLKQYDEALSLLDQVLEIDSSLHEVLIIKARILTAQGKHEEATVLIKQVLDQLPENNALRLQYARMLVEQQKMEAATEQYTILHEKMPDDGEIALSLALLYIETKRLDGAVETLNYLIEINKKVPVANYYLGRITQNQGDDKRAVSYYLGVKSGEYAFDAQLRIGVLLAVLGKQDEGLAKLEALAEEQTSWSLRVKSYLAQGEILRSERRYEEGVEMYSRALQQKRDDTTLLYARG